MVEALRWTALPGINISSGYRAGRYRQRRFQIETFFSALKSRGFHIHKSHLADPARAGRPLLAVCLAYLWITCQGLLVIAEKKTRLIDRTDRPGKTPFRPGSDGIRYALKCNLDFEPVFTFQFSESFASVQKRKAI